MTTTLSIPEITVFPIGRSLGDVRRDRWAALAYDDVAEQLVASSGVKATAEEAEAALVTLIAYGEQIAA